MSSIATLIQYRLSKPRTTNSLRNSSKAIAETWVDLKEGSALRHGRSDWTWNPRNAAPSKVTVTRT